MTNDSGFITVVPSEYITESELTAKGYATQTSVDALSNRIDNLPTGGGSSNVIIDSEFSTTSTNPIQNKVITSAFITAEQEIENLNNRIDNLLANEDSGKELIGEFNLNNTNLTKSSTSGIYSLGSDIQTIMQNAFAKLDEGFDEVLGVITLGDVIFYAQCHYCGGSSSLNVAQNIQCVMSGMAHQNKITLYEFLKNSLRTNETTYIDYVASGTLSMNVKFYKISSGSGMGGGGVQSDWNQNDSSAPDYIKNRPFYKETNTLFDGDVTTILTEGLGGTIGIVESVIIDLSAAQSGDMYDVIYNGISYSYEWNVDFMYFGNFYLYCEQYAESQGMTVEEFIAMMLPYMPEIVDLAVDTGEDFIIMFDTESVMFMTREAGTYHFTINEVSDIKKLDSSMINWAGGGAPSGLPEVTTEDNDKVLMVVDGKWVVGSIANGDEVAY